MSTLSTRPPATRLVYVDPSPRGEWALRMASLLPSGPGDRLVLLATAEDLAADPQLLERARKALAGGAVEELTLPGPAEHAVVAEANRRPYDLVIVPPAGRGAIQRMLKGSRIATIVRALRAPVLVARRPPERIERVLAGVPRGRGALVVCRAAAELADALGAQVAFLHVSSEVALPYHPHDPDYRRRPDAAEDGRRALRELERPERLLVREGLVMDEVLVEFEHGAHQLLVLGASPEASQGWGREDVTGKILQRCPGSTLVVPVEPRDARTRPEPA
jgi:nucleotide-binding universal stress UspA family protein